jgi:hypothetical protein
VASTSTRELVLMCWAFDVLMKGPGPFVLVLAQMLELFPKGLVLLVWGLMQRTRGLVLNMAVRQILVGVWGPDKKGNRQLPTR